MCLLVYVTVPDRECALRLARRLVAEHLAAGVNIIPGILSVYYWRNAIQEHGECLLLAQVAEDAFADVRKAILEDHPYEVPCIMTLPASDGYTDFLQWITDNSRPSAGCASVLPEQRGNRSDLMKQNSLPLQTGKARGVSN